jgi:oligoendopeptidase F
VNRLIAVLAAVLLGATTPVEHSIDLARYFVSPSAEAASRAQVLAGARIFARSATPRDAHALYLWLRRYDALLTDLQRHDVYVYVRAEEDDRDGADAGADSALGKAEDEMYDRLVRAANELGAKSIAALTAQAPLTPYRYLLQTALEASRHTLSPSDARAVAAAVTPVLEASATTYRALRKSSDSIASHEDAYAALLVSIVSANTGVARLRGFAGAPEASYFDKSLSPASVERTLEAVRGSHAYARYRQVAALAPKPTLSPAPIPIDEAISLILAAEQPMGPEYAGQYASLLSAENRRLEICTDTHCDDSGFSVGFSRVTSAAFFGDFDGSVDAARAVSHESGHAVHRQFMNLYQPIAAYNEGPHFMFESFAIFNELLFLDHLYRSGQTDAQRAYYLNFFLGDATFQVYGSAEETDLESAIYQGVTNRSLRTGADFNALASRTFASYDPSAANDPSTPLYWARDRLFFTDPLYDVNYLYAGLLALRYFSDFERDPTQFSKHYVALLKNGFDDTPATLEKKFLGIDLDDEAALVAGADRFIEARTDTLAKLYAWESNPRLRAGARAVGTRGARPAAFGYSAAPISRRAG